MFFFVGLAVVFGCVFGGYIMAGGKMAPIIKAAPIEGFIIVGSAIGAQLIGNSIGIFKGALAGMGKCISGAKWKKQDYLDLILMVGKLLAVMKKEGAVALEAHVENPDSSAIFGEYPRLAKDHSIVHMICDTLRLVVIAQGNLDANAVEDVMTNAIKTHHHDELKYQGGVGGLGIPLLKRVPAWDLVKRADVHCIGHWHQLLDYGRAVVNGSLIGYNAFAQSIGASPEPPQQASEAPSSPSDEPPPEGPLPDKPWKNWG